eukprot:CAMPEP_0176118474 /NCGR_PEP_ID=MMETSP0120_2-20121206/59541_1 /TAXON_ID=160619 /ORGANISM="Kryptoperidinium foliaceum, Strain CCMP 1326" /LENGTH=160 /DNA_ID=CAMNT_0017452815 /DNA_START=137 /DNA_END=615 /DNA_ORIENTATION=+
MRASPATSLLLAFIGCVTRCLAVGRVGVGARALSGEGVGGDSRRLIRREAVANSAADLPATSPELAWLPWPKSVAGMHDDLPQVASMAPKSAAEYALPDMAQLPSAEEPASRTRPLGVWVPLAEFGSGSSPSHEARLVESGLRARSAKSAKSGKSGKHGL